MPHVMVLFDPTKVSQNLVDKIKSVIPGSLAHVLSLKETVSPMHLPLKEDLTTLPKEIFVGQYQAHPTDQNVLPLEIVVNAGRHKGRGPENVKAIFSVMLAGVIPRKLLNGRDTAIWVIFNEVNAHGFIDARRKRART